MTVNPANNPYIKLDANGREIYDSSDDMAFQGDYQGGINLIYSGFARPGSATSSAVWQISKHTYDANNNLTSSLWPLNPAGHASSEYEFVWDDRTTYTYV